MTKIIRFDTPVEPNLPFGFLPTVPPDSLHHTNASQNDPFQVYFLKDAHTQVLNHVYRDTRNECGGVLVGHHFQTLDHKKTFIIITGTIPQLSNDVSVGHFTVGFEEIRATREQLENEYAGLAVVGWYHSHPGHGIFLSGMDQNIVRSFYNSDWHVAHVIDPNQRIEGLFKGAAGTPILFTDRRGARLGATWFGLNEIPAGIEAIRLYNKLEEANQAKDNELARKLRKKLTRFIQTQEGQEFQYWREQDKYQDVSLGIYNKISTQSPGLLESSIKIGPPTTDTEKLDKHPIQDKLNEYIPSSPTPTRRTEQNESYSEPPDSEPLSPKRDRFFIILIGGTLFFLAFISLFSLGRASRDKQKHDPTNTLNNVVSATNTLEMVEATTNESSTSNKATSTPNTSSSAVEIIATLPSSPTPFPTSTSTSTPILVTSTSIPTNTPTGPSPTPTIDNQIIDPSILVFPDENDIVRFKDHQLGSGSNHVIIIAGANGIQSASAILLAYDLIDRFSEYPINIPKSTQIHIIPNLNLDSQSAVLSSRDRIEASDQLFELQNSNNPETSTNQNGVNLNHNWPCRWENTPYAGTSALTEFETYTLSSHLQNLISNNQQIKMIIILDSQQTPSIQSAGCEGPSDKSFDLVVQYQMAIPHLNYETSSLAINTEITGSLANSLAQIYPATFVINIPNKPAYHAQEHIEALIRLLNEN